MVARWDIAALSLFRGHVYVPVSGSTFADPLSYADFIETAFFTYKMDSTLENLLVKHRSEGLLLPPLERLNAAIYTHALDRCGLDLMVYPDDEHIH